MALAIAALVGPFVGAAGGTFFGLKVAINGLNSRSRRIEDTVNEVRDYSRDTWVATEKHVEVGAANLALTKRIHEEVVPK
jgi:hypothetical protein